MVRGAGWKPVQRRGGCWRGRSSQCSLVLLRGVSDLVETGGVRLTKNSDFRVCVSGLIDSWRKFKGKRVRKPSVRSVQHCHGPLSVWLRARCGVCRWPVQHNEEKAAG